ncbi:hypothetical protein QZH56_36970 (plasmid) [Streptomyces olivoreticuli]|uniref:hypothetical protein n=1 Tax=Streptomyces olivoreticuli TaxID=68246 RepID=UPI00265B5358|nr:hypothetical protein [Streptomyces olivoreticuli]WKK27845.1 hypothetical protein QZH56_36970 [Streptomyces olivoreticuli]
MYATNREEIREESGKRAQAKLKRNAVTFQRGRLEKEADALRDKVTERTEEIEGLRETMYELRGERDTLITAARDNLRELSGNTAINVHRLGEHLCQRPRSAPRRRPVICPAGGQVGAPGGGQISPRHRLVWVS